MDQKRLDQQLRLAAASGDEAKLRAALAAGANPGSTDRDKRSALMQASACGRLECLLILIPLSDTRAQDIDGLSAAHLASWLGHAPCARALAPVSDLCATAQAGMTPLMMACLHGHSACVEELLPFCDPGALNAFDRSAAMIALENDHIKLAHRLMAAEEARMLTLSLQELEARAEAMAKIRKGMEATLEGVRIEISIIEAEARDAALASGAPSKGRKARAPQALSPATPAPERDPRRL